MLSHVFGAVDKTSSSFSAHGKIDNFIIIYAYAKSAHLERKSLYGLQMNRTDTGSWSLTDAWSTSCLQSAFHSESASHVGNRTDKILRVRISSCLSLAKSRTWRRPISLLRTQVAFLRRRISLLTVSAIQYTSTISQLYKLYVWSLYLVADQVCELSERSRGANVDWTPRGKWGVGRGVTSPLRWSLRRSPSPKIHIIFWC